jgi:hypothetical protein
MGLTPDPSQSSSFKAMMTFFLACILSAGETLSSKSMKIASTPDLNPFSNNLGDDAGMAKVLLCFKSSISGYFV